MILVYGVPYGPGVGEGGKRGHESTVGGGVYLYL